MMRYSGCHWYSFRYLWNMKAVLSCLCVLHVHHASQTLSLIVRYCQWLSMTNFRNEDLAILCLSWAVIGYSSGQDGSILPTWDYLVCLGRKKCSFSHKKSWLTSLFGQDGLILATIVFCVGMCTSTLFRCIKKRSWAISSHLYLILGQ